MAKKKRQRLGKRLEAAAKKKLTKIKKSAKKSAKRSAIAAAKQATGQSPAQTIRRFEKNGWSPEQIQALTGVPISTQRRIKTGRAPGTKWKESLRESQRASRRPAPPDGEHIPPTRARQRMVARDDLRAVARGRPRPSVVAAQKAANREQHALRQSQLRAVLQDPGYGARKIRHAQATMALTDAEKKRLEKAVDRQVRRDAKDRDAINRALKQYKQGKIPLDHLQGIIDARPEAAWYFAAQPYVTAEKISQKIKAETSARSVIPLPEEEEEEEEEEYEVIATSTSSGAVASTPPAFVNIQKITL